MNIKEIHDTIVKDHAHKVADYVDSASYGYIVGQLQAIEARGEDPKDYEVIFLASEMEQTIDGYRVTNRLRVKKIHG